MLPGVEIKVGKMFIKKKNQGSKWNKKMGGRSCFVTIGAFGHGLLHNGLTNCTVTTIQYRTKVYGTAL